MIDFSEDDGVVDISKELMRLLDKIDDLKRQDKNVDALVKQYDELKALHDKGETHYVKF